MENFVEGIIAIMVAAGLGSGVRCFLNWAVQMPQPPGGITQAEWNAITKRVDAGGPIGFFERLLIALSFFTEKEAIIAAWFGFKVAAKWEAWKNIVQVPSRVDQIPQLAWFQVTKLFGSWVLSRFLVGTLVNLAIGAFAAYVGKNSFELVSWLYVLRIA